MAYDPFEPGPFRVATSTDALVDHMRERTLPYEVWRPVSEAPKKGFPLILYSHSSYGHRRQSALLLTHLASHGYVVAAADHSGNTAADWGGAAPAVPALSPEEREARTARIIAHRVPDLRFIVDALLGGAQDVAACIDPARLGLLGWSFGGWAVLATLEHDDRFGAVVAMAPAGSSKPLPGIIPATLKFVWKRRVPALFLVAERDRFTPLEGEQELFARAPLPRRMFILRGADHGHFADVIDEPGACSPEHAHLFTRGLTLAHFDAALKFDDDAAEFIASDAPSSLRRRGIAAISASVDRVQ